MSKPERVIQTPGEASPADTVAEKPAAEKPNGVRAVDVDPTKIKRAVLTLDGWVCPEIAPGYAGEH